VIHPTYRSLDAPVKLLGLSWSQWLCLLVGGGALIACVHYLGVPTRPAISFCTIAIGVPLALACLSEETGFSFGRLVWDMVRWRCERHRLEPGAGAGVGVVVASGAGDGRRSRLSGWGKEVR
jgi:hypothetical protein